jgi:hypothetical protein
LVFSAAAVLAEPSLTVFVVCVLVSAVLLVILGLGWRRYGARWIT